MRIVDNPNTGVPVYEYTEQDFVQQAPPWTDGQPSQLSQFDKELYRRWDGAMAAGAFRYGIDHILTRIFPGSKGYVGQLNTLRENLRRKPQEITSLTQPFNHKDFNFTWVKPSETVFDLRNISTCCEQNELPGEKLEDNSRTAVNGYDIRKEDIHRLVINVSPMEHGHCLLVPEIYKENPQILTLTSLKVAIETMALSGHRGLRIGMNSLCAFASVNHLHFHFFYLDYVLIVDYCHVDHLSGEYYEFSALPCPGFAIQLHGTTIDGLARSAHRITSWLHQKDIAHNLFMCRGLVFGEEKGSTLTTIRLFIWPREKFIGKKSSDEFNAACIELAGHLPIKEENGYRNLTEADVDKIIETACLSDELYHSIKEEIIQMGKTPIDVS